MNSRECQPAVAVPMPEQPLDQRNPATEVNAEIVGRALEAINESAAQVRARDADLARRFGVRLAWRDG